MWWNPLLTWILESKWSVRRYWEIAADKVKQRRGYLSWTMLQPAVNWYWLKRNIPAWLSFGNSSSLESTRNSKCFSTISKPKGTKKHSQMHLLKSKSQSVQKTERFQKWSKVHWLLFVPLSSSLFQCLGVNGNNAPTTFPTLGLNGAVARARSHRSDIDDIVSKIKKWEESSADKAFRCRVTFIIIIIIIFVKL